MTACPGGAGSLEGRSGVGRRAGTLSQSRAESAPVCWHNAYGKGGHVQQRESKSKGVFREKRETGTIKTVYCMLVCGIQFEKGQL